MRLTIAVISYQRRERLVRLLRAIGPQARELADAGIDVGVVVVVDGSTDGSADAAGAIQIGVPLDVRWQPNRGRAAARNVGLQAGAGGLVLFLDDDLIPGPDLVRRHWQGHAGGAVRVLMGPCRPLPAARRSPLWLRWWEQHYGALTAHPLVTRFDQVTTANTSGPASVFADAGGFDESFVGYGLEDYELGVRLLQRGVRIEFDAGAEAWHDYREDARAARERQRSIGRNSVHLVRKHPDTLPQVFPAQRRSLPVRVVAAMPHRSPAALARLGRVTGAIADAGGGAVTRLTGVPYDIANVALLASGVAEVDPALVTLVLDEHRG